MEYPKQITLIGDAHGKEQEYLNIVNSLESGRKSLQVGDLGFKQTYDRVISEIDISIHKSLKGNHDWYPYLNKYNCLGDYGMWEGVYYVRGAKSIDAHVRTEGVDWFSNEELTYVDFRRCVYDFVDLKPKVVVTHDCPQSINDILFGYTLKIPTITGQGLDVLWESHKPELWVFGHHHRSVDRVIDGCRFVCLAELETFSLK